MRHWPHPGCTALFLTLPRPAIQGRTPAQRLGRRESGVGRPIRLVCLVGDHKGSQAGQAGLCELSVSRSEAEKEGAPAAGDCPQSVATGWMVEAPVNSDPLACP